MTSAEGNEDEAALVERLKAVDDEATLDVELAEEGWMTVYVEAIERETDPLTASAERTVFFRTLDGDSLTVTVEFRQHHENRITMATLEEEDADERRLVQIEAVKESEQGSLSSLDSQI
jgi:hypothetical protein